MLEIKVHHDFTRPVASLWALLEDFAVIDKWWPKDDPSVLIERVELEGQGIGLIRHIYNVGFVKPVSEQLDAQDAKAHTYSLSIVGDRPAGLLHYQAHARLEPLEVGCRLHYHSFFETQAGREAEAESFLRGAYALMFRGLEQSA